jgi:hypothetical protein
VIVDELEREVSNLISNMPEVADQMFTAVYEAQFVGQYEMFGFPRYAIVHSGRDLRAGMIVVVANPARRQRISPLMTDPEIHRAMRWNRWCMVVETPDDHPYILVMKGRYRDNVIEERLTSINESWYVLRSSIHAHHEGDVG